MTDDSLDGRFSDASVVRLRRLLQQHFDFVWRTVRRLGLDDAEAEDACQEVFWVVARRLARIQEERERSFIFGTALRTAATYRRSRKRRAELVLPSLDEEQTTALDPEQIHQQIEDRAMLEEILTSMDLDLRAVFVLFELEELSGPAIADLLGLPIGTVNSRLRRARDVFREAARRSQSRRSRGHGR